METQELPSALGRGAFTVVRAFMTYMWNADWDMLARMVYSDTAGEDYLEEKACLWHEDPFTWFTQLDDGNQRKVVEDAWNTYGAHAMELDALDEKYSRVLGQLA